jgi:hypothetical protein
LDFERKHFSATASSGIPVAAWDGRYGQGFLVDVLLEAIMRIQYS